jgi:hypothetical protein
VRRLSKEKLPARNGVPVFANLPISRKVTVAFSAAECTRLSRTNVRPQSEVIMRRQPRYNT